MKIGCLFQLCQFVPNPTYTDAGVGSIDVVNITTIGKDMILWEL
jgi:hypothetical protein